MPHISPSVPQPPHQSTTKTSTSEPFEPPTFEALLQRHISACEAHKRFLDNCKRARSPICTTSDDLDRLSSMIESASLAAAQATEIRKLWAATRKIEAQHGSGSSPEAKLPVRNKRASLPAADEEETPKAKKRRTSIKAARPTTPSASSRETPQAPKVVPDSAVEVEYADITDEVNERLQAREQRRQAGTQTGTPVASKRKRRSSGIMQPDGKENADQDGEMERGAKRRAGRISMGGTRQIKKLKTKKVDGPSVVDGAGEVKGTRSMEQPEVLVKKKRRRSTAVGGANAGENRFASDDRAVKRTRR